MSKFTRKVSVKRLEPALRPAGFIAICHDRGEIEFIRRRAEWLFERVSVHQGWMRGGRLGDIVSATIGCSVAPAGPGEHRYLRLPTDDSTGWTHLRGVADAKAWEQKFVELAPPAVVKLADETGPALLAATAPVRMVLAEYLRRFPLESSVESALAALQARGTAAQLQEAHRLIRTQLQTNPDGKPSYQLAALAVVMLAGELGSAVQSLLDRKPSAGAGDQLTHLRHLLVSRIARGPAWELPVLSP